MKSIQIAFNELESRADDVVLMFFFLRMKMGGCNDVSLTKHARAHLAGYHWLRVMCSVYYLSSKMAVNDVIIDPSTVVQMLRAGTFDNNTHLQVYCY